jgi:hypothetical protein
MRTQVVRLLNSLHAIAVENRVGAGTPDVEAMGSWLELKQLPAWPVRADTVTRVEHFKLEQRLFLETRWERGGNAFLLLKVKQEWLLFDGDVAAKIVGHVPRATLIANVRHYWPRGIDKELLTCIHR